MRKTKFTETQIVKAIKDHESGRNALEICRELGISTAAFYKWRQRYGGMEVTLIYEQIICANLRNQWQKAFSA